MHIVSALIFTICNIVIARTIIGLFGLDARALRMMQRFLQLPPEQIYLMAWGMSAAVGLLALICWLSFNLEDRLYNRWSPGPALGSYHQVNGIAQVFRNQKSNTTNVEMVAEMQNDNDVLLAFHCELRATVNGKDLDKPIIFDGYANAKSRNFLIVRIDDVPTQITDGHAPLLANMRYNVTYYFANNKRRTRRTSKLLRFETVFQATGVAIGTQTMQTTTVRYFDEIEE